MKLVSDRQDFLALFAWLDLTLIIRQQLSSNEKLPLIIKE
jgi:hypothetical protein